ncbi:MAG: winged helix-turn-helix transcriptional regulator [Thermoplasmata archaeon]|nr:winged helix-turn-helix transcriptional regulator [Thermoplasmata archaeon]MCK5397455.1 winged helix-turn-helix transcriptional regulator [Thermoplasmata archaeon]
MTSWRNESIPKIGDALKKAVEVKPQEKIDRSRSRASSALMNSNRRNIFQYLCRQPCSGIGQISEALELSRSTVSWHIDYLVKSGYLDHELTGKKRAYCPAALLTRKSMQVFSFLNHSSSLKLYQEILNEPGQDKAMLRKKVEASNSHVSEILKSMIDMQLISSVRDGKHVRFFPTDESVQIMKKDLASQKEFIRFLIKKMSSEHLQPEIADLKGGGVTIHLKVPGQTAKIEIPYYPFENFISDR